MYREKTLLNHFDLDCGVLRVTNQLAPLSCRDTSTHHGILNCEHGADREMKVVVGWMGGESCSTKAFVQVRDERVGDSTARFLACTNW